MACAKGGGVKRRKEVQVKKVVVGVIGSEGVRTIIQSVVDIR